MKQKYLILSISFLIFLGNISAQNDSTWNQLPNSYYQTAVYDSLGNIHPTMNIDHNDTMVINGLVVRGFSLKDKTTGLTSWAADMKDMYSNDLHQAYGGDFGRSFQLGPGDVCFSGASYEGSSTDSTLFAIFADSIQGVTNELWYGQPDKEFKRTSPPSLDEYQSAPLGLAIIRDATDVSRFKTIAITFSVLEPWMDPADAARLKLNASPPPLGDFLNGQQFSVRNVQKIRYRGEMRLALLCDNVRGVGVSRFILLINFWTQKVEVLFLDPPGVTRAAEDAPYADLMGFAYQPLANGESLFFVYGTDSIMSPTVTRAGAMLLYLDDPIQDTFRFVTDLMEYGQPLRDTLSDRGYEITSAKFLGNSVANTSSGKTAYVLGILINDIGSSDQYIELSYDFDTLTEVFTVDTTITLLYGGVGLGNLTGLYGMYDIGGDTMVFSTGNVMNGNATGVTRGVQIRHNGALRVGRDRVTVITGTFPIKLIAYNAKQIGEEHRVLNRFVVEEIDVLFYEIQRSTDGINFETVDILWAKGNGYNTYNWIDEDPIIGGENYYRFITVNIDGSEDFSPIRVVTIEAFLDMSSIQVYPNPVTLGQQNLNIKLPEGYEDVEVEWNIISVTGKYITGGSFTGGRESISLDQSLAGGMYLLQVTSHMGTQVKRIVVRQPRA